MTELLVRYRDFDGSFSERLVSDIAVEGDDSILAFCHLRQGRRTFKLNRIQSIVDPSTGEIIEDVLAFIGAHPSAVIFPIPLHPILGSSTLNGAALRNLRTAEKYAFWRPCRFAVVADLCKRKFFALFGNRCFKCGATSTLEIDHHVPMTLGGHLVPGNLVALCPRCNNRKLEQAPEEFYSPEELKVLLPILEQEDSFFASTFQFDWEFWDRDRRGFLLQIGIDPKLVEEVLNNPEHRYYIPPLSPPVQGTCVAITVDLSFLTGKP
jgi:hypothetical protein